MSGDPVARLREANERARTEYPLPRCKHGATLMDHGGEMLVPDCGCRLTKAIVARWFQAAFAAKGQ